MFNKALLLAVFFALTPVPARAAADFYGVQMKSEDFARDIFVVENNKIPDFANSRAGIDKRIYAYGYMSSVVGGGHGFSVEVFNHSDKTILTDKLFRDLTIVTYDGRRYDRSETEMMWSRDRMAPGQEATFNFKFPGIRVARDEIRMVVCSFDLDGVSIYLFPLKPAEPIAQKTPAKAVKKEAPAAKEKKPTVKAPFCPAPVKLLQSFFKGISDRARGEDPRASTDAEAAAEPVEQGQVVTASVTPGDKQRTPDYPLVKPEQVIEGARYHFSPDFRKEVQESQKGVEAVVYRDRPWSLSNPDKLFTHGETPVKSSEGFPRREARVVLVNPEYGFVVVDAGFESGFGKNVILDVVRNGRRIAKVMITKPRDKISGAVILPEWRTRDEIRSGDIVGMSI